MVDALMARVDLPDGDVNLMLCSVLADRLHLPMFFDRGKPKGHGMKRRYEGSTPDQYDTVVEVRVLKWQGKTYNKKAEVV